MDSEIVTQEVLRRLISSKERVDKRKVSESRPTKVITSSDDTNQSTSTPTMMMIANACGSSMVCHGNTLVTCAITTELSPVLPSAPDRGFLQVDIIYNQATCFATPRNDAATLQPSPDDRDASWASEASHTLQKALEISNVVDLKSLLIAEGEGCFVLKICCVVNQDDGGVLEACGAAIQSALENFQFPRFFTLPDGSKNDWETPSETKSIFTSSAQKKESLKLSTVGFLFVKQTVAENEDGTKKVTRTSCLNSSTEANEVIIVVDPTSPEAVICDGVVTVAKKSSGRLLSVTSHGGKPATMQVLEAITKFVLTH